jgi:hypothetical protein
MAQDQVALVLTRAEAIVLFECLSLLEENEWKRPPDETELQVFWSLEAQLEHALVEQFSPEYDEILQRARREVRDKKPGA